MTELFLGAAVRDCTANRQTIREDHGIPSLASYPSVTDPTAVQLRSEKMVNTTRLKFQTAMNFKSNQPICWTITAALPTWFPFYYITMASSALPLHFSITPTSVLTLCPRKMMLQANLCPSRANITDSEYYDPTSDCSKEGLAVRNALQFSPATTLTYFTLTYSLRKEFPMGSAPFGNHPSGLATLKLEDQDKSNPPLRSQHSA